MDKYKIPLISLKFDKFFGTNSPKLSKTEKRSKQRCTTVCFITSFRNHGRSDVENVGKKWFWCFWGVNWVRFSRFYQKKSKKNFQKKSYVNLQILIFRNFSEFARNSTALKKFKYFFWCTNKRRFYWCYIWKEFGAETCSFAAKSDEGRVTGSKSGTKNWKSLVYLWNVLKPTLQTKSSL